MLSEFLLVLPDMGTGVAAIIVFACMPDSRKESNQWGAPPDKACNPPCFLYTGDSVMETTPQTNAQSTSSAPRIEWIDILKGLAILLVVIGHMEYAEGTANPGKVLIGSFHMPLFFMLSGYTAALSLSRNPNLLNFIYRRFRSLMVPYICWMLALPCIYATPELLSQYSFHSTCMGILSGWGQWWFLPCLFLLQLVFVVYSLLCRRLKSGVWAGVIFLLLFAALYLGHRFGLPQLEKLPIKIFYIQHVYTMFLPFSLGVAMFELPRVKAAVTGSKLLASLAVVVFAVLCRARSEFLPTYGWILTGLSGCILMASLFARTSQANTNRFGAAILNQLKCFGKCSMAIYVLSYLLIPATPLFPDASAPQLAVFCGNFLLGLVICYACVGLKAIINLSPFLSAAFLGEFPKRKKVAEASTPN